ncbi:MAG: hypothetical protein JO257_04675 [Deltaproteobacteria bacterium]|nr:hypothetical protein [Deltaproteobacteria bacterium]
MKRGFVAIALASALAVPSAYAFDTFWHSAASEGAAQHHGFTADAVNVLQFGTFGPDFFGPLYDTGPGHYVEDWEADLAEKAKAFFDLRGKASGVRKAGVLMHFDNLYGELDRDWKVDYLFRRLLDNTQRTINALYNTPKLNEGTRKLLVLITLGSSLHMVEDFYSHSNWAHFDFVGMCFPQQKSFWGQDYAPSWFQVADKLGPPSLDATETWPLEARSGIYPPPKTAPPKDAFGTPLDHAMMNHDNSQLFYEKASQIPHHGFGPHPAKDAATASEHQLYSINTAAMAANEWIDLVEQEPGAKAAIDDARNWEIKQYNPAMLKDLEGGLQGVFLMSCAAKKWDGDHPPKSRATQCTAYKGGLSIPTPFNEYWAAYIDHDILEQLTKGLGDASGHYSFDLSWYKAHRPAEPKKPSVDLDALGLQIEAPFCTKPQPAAAGPAKKGVRLTGPAIGIIDVTPADAPVSEADAEKAETSKPAEKSSQDPDDYQLIYAIPTGFKVVGQRKLGPHAYKCGGTGNATQAHAIAAACQHLQLLME